MYHRGVLSGMYLTPFYLILKTDNSVRLVKIINYGAMSLIIPGACFITTFHNIFPNRWMRYQITIIEKIISGDRGMDPDAMTFLKPIKEICKALDLNQEHCWPQGLGSISVNYIDLCKLSRIVHILYGVNL